MKNFKATKTWLNKNNIAFTEAENGFIEVSHNLRIPANEQIKLEGIAEVSGSVYVRENAKFTAPALAEVGEIRFKTTMFGKKIDVFDGMGCIVLSEKERDGITIKYSRKASFKDRKLVGDKYYIATSGDHNAHGESIEMALSDLSFKTADRDVSVYKNMGMETVKTPYEWATIYRIITGACNLGTQDFITNQGDLKGQYKLSEVIEKTKGHFGSDRFINIVG